MRENIIEWSRGREPMSSVLVGSSNKIIKEKYVERTEVLKLERSGTCERERVSYVHTPGTFDGNPGGPRVTCRIQSSASPFNYTVLVYQFLYMNL